MKFKTIKRVCDETGCDMYDAKKALTHADGCWECAVEYVRRVKLAAAMSDEAKFPTWYQDSRHQLLEYLQLRELLVQLKAFKHTREGKH